MVPSIHYLYNIGVVSYQIIFALKVETRLMIFNLSTYQT